MAKFPSIPINFSIGPVYREVLYKIAMLGAHQDILEIGCLNGYSTSALTTALDDGAEFNLTLCDVNLTPGVKNLVGRCSKPVTLRQCPSKSVINFTYDLIFVDGDHELQTVKEEIKLLLGCCTKTIIFHDTHIIREPRFWGAVLGKAIFDVHPEYYGFTLHSAKEYYLSLGFSVYTRDKDLYETMYSLLSGGVYNIYPSNVEKHMFYAQKNYKLDSRLRKAGSVKLL